MEAVKEVVNFGLTIRFPNKNGMPSLIWNVNPKDDRGPIYSRMGILVLNFNGMRLRLK